MERYCALDLIETWPGIDRKRMGITGRSGGGAYSWYAAALDDRIRVAVPVAGITDLQNHIVDGCVEGHCDCMYMINYFGWDYPKLAALIAPRPLLLANSDADGIFPLDGVLRTHQAIANVYANLGAKDKLGLLITPGPHQDTQAAGIRRTFVRISTFFCVSEGAISRSNLTIPPPQIERLHCGI